ncbi:MAG: DUF3078 domain-containing protein [bacterium]
MKLVLMLLTIVDLLGANAPTDTTKTNGIYSSGVAGLNVSQIAFTNWSQGGENSLTWSVFGDFGLKYVKDSMVVKNNLKISYGKTKNGDESYKTNNNEIYLESVLLYRVGWQIDPYFSNTVRTVITKGFDYSNQEPMPISNFFDPGYITQSIGFSYNKITGFSTRLGVAIQEVFTDKYRNYSDKPDTKTKIEAFKFETGMESVSEGKFTLHENLLLTSKLRLFTRFEHIDVWDVRWDNTIVAKITSLVNVNLNVLMIYEKSQSLKTQLKEALQLGITYTLF